ncbi:hypothetical protein PYW08_006133 [Mythimna loreyi]|uniref:Uncharacterized protein n=1 Tax=Mythimna loreyi TaxID=667449 RepID=A0ACC2QMC1_9NEOP|nr:hypothetical protein PYW08_006133 [Mythimna loreyi]
MKKVLQDAKLKTLLRQNDGFVVDRGFRDAVGDITKEGYTVLMPAIKDATSLKVASPGILPGGDLGRIERRPAVRPARRLDVEVPRPDDVDIAEDVEEEEDAQRPPTPNPAHQPTANLLGWRQATALNKNQLGEITQISEDPVEVEYVFQRRREAEKNVDQDTKKIVKLTEDSFASVTAEDWFKQCKHVENLEDEYFRNDGLIDEEMDCFIISTASDSVTESDHDSDIHLDDSDSDCSNFIYILAAIANMRPEVLHIKVMLIGTSKEKCIKGGDKSLMKSFTVI